MEPQTIRSRTIRGFVVRMLLILVLFCGSACLGKVVFGHIPIANWMLGALTGVAGVTSLAMLLDC